MKFLSKSIATISCLLILQACTHTPQALKGLPSIDQSWTGKDYQTAIIELNKRQQPLPRFNSRAGTMLIEHITDEDNLKIYTDQKVPLAERVGQFTLLNQSIGLLIEQYSVLTKVDFSVNNELSQMITFALKAAAKGVKLAEEMKKADNGRGNVKPLYAGVTGMYDGAAEFALKNRMLQDENRSVILEGMYETLPTFIDAFSSNYKARLRNQLALYLNTFKDKSEQKKLLKMINMLR